MPILDVPVYVAELLLCIGAIVVIVRCRKND